MSRNESASEGPEKTKTHDPEWCAITSNFHKRRSHVCMLICAPDSSPDHKKKHKHRDTKWEHKTSLFAAPRFAFVAVDISEMRYKRTGIDLHLLMRHNIAQTESETKQIAMSQMGN